MTTTERGTCWSVTINNPTPEDEDCIAKARAKRWQVEGQLEKGEKGTPHYQLMVRTPQVRSSAVRSAFPRAHVELAKNAKALAKYVTKEETRAGELPTGSDKFPSLEKTYCMFVTHVCERRIREMNYAMPQHAVTVMMDEEINKWRNEDVVKAFDDWCHIAIEDGYFVEQWAVNPQIRSALLKFGKSIMVRHAAINDRQNFSQIKNITNADEEETLSAEVETYSPPPDGAPA